IFRRGFLARYDCTFNVWLVAGWTSLALAIISKFMYWHVVRCFVRCYDPVRKPKSRTHSAQMDLGESGIVGHQSGISWNGNDDDSAEYVSACVCSIGYRCASNCSRLYLSQYESHLATLFGIFGYALSIHWLPKYGFSRHTFRDYGYFTFFVSSFSWTGVDACR